MQATSRCAMRGLSQALLCPVVRTSTPTPLRLVELRFCSWDEGRVVRPLNILNLLGNRVFAGQKLKWSVPIDAPKAPPTPAPVAIRLTHLLSISKILLHTSILHPRLQKLRNWIYSCTCIQRRLSGGRKGSWIFLMEDVMAKGEGRGAKKGTGRLANRKVLFSWAELILKPTSLPGWPIVSVLRTAQD